MMLKSVGSGFVVTLALASAPGRLFHCYMLDESICHFGGVRSILSLLFFF